MNSELAGTAAEVGEGAGKSPVEPSRARALRTAGSMLVLMAALNATLTFMGANSGAVVVGAVVDVILGVKLLALDDRFDVLVQLRAVAGALAFPFLAFSTQALPDAAIGTVLQWAYSAALLLCVTERAAPWRVRVAVALFVMFALVPTMIGILAILFTGEVTP